MPLIHWNSAVFTVPFRAAMAFALVAAGLVQSNVQGRETLSPSEAARVGLVDAWQRQLTIAGGLDGLVDAEIVVDEENVRQFVELSADGKLVMRIATTQLNAYGVPIGLDEAKRLALMETYKYKRKGLETAIDVVEVPEIRLYALGADGTVECRDAEDGRVLWLQRVGDPRIEALPMSVDRRHVAFVNANQLFVLNSRTGELIAQKQMKGVPLHGPALVGEYVICLCTGGRVEGYWLSDMKREPFTARAAGLPMAGPVASHALPRMMWPTDKGYLYALDGAGQAEMVFRFPAVGLVSAPLATGPSGRFYAGTERGHVYCVSPEINGKIEWHQSVGGAIYSAPLVVGSNVYVKNVYGQMFCLDAASGDYQWAAPLGSIERVLGGNGKEILVRTVSATMQAIDAESGSVITQLPAASIQDSIHNPWTDRIYLLSSGGVVQCLRPIGKELPTLLESEVQSGNTAGGSATTPESAKEPPEKNPFGFGAEPGNNPFGGGNGGGNDPFGGGAGGNDPFGGDGGGNDPFGGGAGGNDPFGGAGGGNDPFGGMDASDDPFGG